MMINYGMKTLKRFSIKHWDQGLTEILERESFTPEIDDTKNDIFCDTVDTLLCALSSTDPSTLGKEQAQEISNAQL